MKPELHLFIIWEKGRFIQDTILGDIAKYFTILKQYEITWTPSLVASNFTRFCGTRLRDHLHYKIDNCGVGEFLLVIVRDDSPIYENRDTFHGPALVNVKMYEAKQRYREWTGGGIRVHATDSIVETNHDLTLLIGKNIEDFLKYDLYTKVEKLHRDIEGANGWDSILQLFYVLNNTVRYAVMRGYGELASGDFIDHGDTDIITDDYYNLWLIVNSPKKYADRKKPKAIVKIGDQSYLLDIWNNNIKDGYNYFDPIWAQNMLDCAIEWNGMRILNPENDFYCLLYHCLINKGYIADDYLVKLMRYKQEFQLAENDWNKILVDFLNKNHYEVICPKDDTCPFNISNPEIQKFALRYGGECVDIQSVEVNGISSIIKEFHRKKSIIKQGEHYIIELERSILSKIGKNDLFPRILSFGMSEEGMWIEESCVEGVMWAEYWGKHQNWTISNAKKVTRQLIEGIFALYSRGISWNNLMADSIKINEKTLQLYLSDFSKASRFPTQDTVVDSDFIECAKFLKAQFGNSTYYKSLEGVLLSLTTDKCADEEYINKQMNEINSILNSSMDIKSSFKFCRKKYKFLKTYIHNPKALCKTMCPHIIQRGIKKFRKLLKRIC